MAYVSGKLVRTYSPLKANMTMKKTFEDTSLIENGNFPASHVYFFGGTSFHGSFGIRFPSPHRRSLPVHCKESSRPSGWLTCHGHLDGFMESHVFEGIEMKLVNAVDGRSPVNSPVEVGNSSHYLQGFSTIPGGAGCFSSTV